MPVEEIFVGLDVTKTYKVDRIIRLFAETLGAVGDEELAALRRKLERTVAARARRCERASLRSLWVVEGDDLYGIASYHAIRTARCRLEEQPLLRSVNAVMRRIRVLSDTDLEAVGALLLEEAGFTALQTRPQKDDGFDFVGWKTDRFFGWNSMSLVVGSAKHYAADAPVGPEAVRELRGAIDSLFELRRAHVPGEVVRTLLDPLTSLRGVIVASSRLSDAALELCVHWRFAVFELDDIALSLCLRSRYVTEEGFDESAFIERVQALRHGVRGPMGS